MRNEAIRLRMKAWYWVMALEEGVEIAMVELWLDVLTDQGQLPYSRLGIRM